MPRQPHRPHSDRDGATVGGRRDRPRERRQDVEARLRAAPEAPCRREQGPLTRSAAIPRSRARIIAPRPSPAEQDGVRMLFEIVGEGPEASAPPPSARAASVLRSGTAAASASSRRAPSGRPVGSTEAPADAASSSTLAAKVKRPVSQAVTPVVSKARRRGAEPWPAPPRPGLRPRADRAASSSRKAAARACRRRSDARPGPTSARAAPRWRRPPPHARARTIRTR